MTKQPPSNLEAEKAVLGGLLMNSDAYEEIEGILSAGDFWVEAHAWIFQAITEAIAAYGRADILLVSNALGKKLETIGGYPYLTSLVSGVAITANIEHWARIVKEKSVLRSVISRASKISFLASGDEKTSKQVQSILEESESLSMELLDQGMVEGRKMKPIKVHITAAMRRIEADMSGGKREDITPTGLSAVDRYAGGLVFSEVAVLAARPGQGKTTLACQEAHHAAVNLGVPVVFISAEMSAAQLAARMVRCASMGGPWSRMAGEAVKIEQAKLYFLEYDLHPGRIALEVKRIRSISGHIGLIVVDYLQLITPAKTTSKTRNREQEVAQLSKFFRELAKENECPVRLLAQLNRSCETRASKRPTMADLRESGSVEQDADVIEFIWNDPEKEQTYIIREKNRDGETGQSPVVFRKDHSRFYDQERGGW